MVRIALTFTAAALALSLSGCCYGTRLYVQPVGPFQAATIHTTALVTAPQNADVGPRVNITRRYMGPRPTWYETGYYLPEPRIVRACDGSLYVEEYVWGYPPPDVAPKPPHPSVPSN